MNALIVSRLWHYTTAMAAFWLNAFLIVVILKCSPRVMKTYRMFMLTTAFVHWTSCLLLSFILGSYPPNGLNLNNCYFGVCRYFGANTCFYAYILLEILFVFDAFIFPFSFIYRYHATHGKEFSKRKVVGLISCALGIAVIFGISLFGSRDDRFILPNITGRYEVHADEIEVIAYLSFFEFPPIVIYIIMTIFSFTLPVNWYYRKKTNELLDISTSLSPAVTTLWKQLMKALTIQSILPVFYMLGNLSLLLNILVFDIVWLDFLCHNLSACTAVISPIMTIYFITPYRTAVTKLVRRPNTVSSVMRSTRTKHNQSTVNI